MVPFAPNEWPSPELREAAAGLWAWNRAVRNLQLSDAVQQEARQICQRHDLPESLLAAQQQGARIEDGYAVAEELLTYMDTVMGAHAMLLAKLAGERSRWVEQPVHAFARAVFMTRRLCRIKHDLQAGRLWIPRDVMQQAGVERAHLESGEVTPGVRRLLWKQVVLARDAYAGCRTLTTDFSGWLRRRFRMAWTRGVHMLALIEARRFDVWSRPVELAGFRRAQLYWQVYVGKTFR
ncbi:MAG: squalene/phytoene synthase family protein [Bacteroidota bacterium]|nr:squalene/phytoene synthase family protein [Bacteroidota bacterium]